MSGVEILSQTPIVEMVLPSWYVWCVIAPLAGAIIFFVLAVISNDAVGAAVSAIWCMVLALLIIFVKDFEEKIPTGRYQYRAKISNVNLNELTSSYEIIGQDGEVWILEDKEWAR